jgi:outer membrane lipoprotein-sorting protein
MKTLTIATLFLSLVCFPLVAIEPSEGQVILDRIDVAINFEEGDFAAIMTMISEDPETGVEKRVVQQFRRDSQDKFLILFQEPVTQKGQGYLRVDDNLWFYDPESRKFSHSSMKEQFSGTDANNSDFGQSSLADDYRVAEIAEGKLGKYDVYIMVLDATNNEVTYPKTKIWVTEESNLVLKKEDYSANGRMMRTSFFPSYTKAGDRFIVTKMIFVDNLIDGKKTQITLNDVSVDPLPDSLFTKAHVERVSR